MSFPERSLVIGALLERLAEIALLISLFAVGLRLGVPLRDPRWRLPLRLAFVSMAVMVAMLSAIGVRWLQLVVYLRSRHGEAVGLDEFLGLGLVAMAYGIAQLSLASGFLAVFAAGMALQRVRERPRPHTRALPAATGSAGSAAGHPYEKLATHSHHASATMRDSVRGFNAQLEKLAEMTLVLTLGAMLAYAKPLPAALWFVPLILLVLRPLSVVAALAGERLSWQRQAMVGWFGIRGIGSVFYLLFVLRHGVDGPVAETLISLTLWTVAASIVAHGVTAQPLMHRYFAQRRRVPAKALAKTETP